MRWTSRFSQNYGVMTRYALVIGIQKYGGAGFGDLEKPVQDAEAIAQILEKHGDFTVTRLPKRWHNDKECYEVAEEQLTGTDLGKAIKDFFEQVGSNEALVYFSGHGFEVTDVMDHRSGYLVTSDCTTETVRNKGLPLDSLNRLILNARCSSLVLLLDCCHAGRLLEKSQITSALTAFNAGERNYFLATACRGHEKAYEGQEYSLFTEALIKALKTPGKDGFVRTSRLNHLIDEQLRDSGQEPVVLKSGGEITLAHYTHPWPQLGKNRQEVAREMQFSETGQPRIRGLMPLEEPIPQGPFRAYLSSETLPYYSRAEHLRIDPAPENVSIPNEVELLQQLDNQNLTGFIITGSGGVGKTRLMLEIGRQALANNWLVYRVRERLKTDGIYQLAEQIEPSQKVLLLIDYAETQQDFADLVATLQALNEDKGVQFRYIANCRTTYYSSIRETYQHQRVDLSPSDDALEWFSQYRSETVRHILHKSGVGATDTYLSLCRDTPILAVFLAYLHNCGRDVDLASLVGETNFGSWLMKRIRLSFKTSDIGFKTSDIERELALLIAQFPLNNAVAKDICRDQYHIFDRLATDRWIEKNQFPIDCSGEQIWTTIHDVLADQVLTSYLESIPHTTEIFVCELLKFAIRIGCLRSTLYTLQRLINLHQLNRLDWVNILRSKMSSAPSAWKEIRDVLIRTSLLKISELLTLLGEHEMIWEGIEAEVDFQNSLAWLIQQFQDPVNHLDDSNRIILDKWIQKAIPHVSPVNLLLTRGLGFCPAIVQEAALNWIKKHPRKFQTHYLLKVWLKKGLPTEDVSCTVQQWCEQFPQDERLSSVFQVWLEAKGEKVLIQPYLSKWLSRNATTWEANYVYKAWLNADGEKEQIRKYLLEWLSSDANALHLEASFVYRAWLDAKGDLQLIQERFDQWLSTYATTSNAGFVYIAWLGAKGDLQLIQNSLVQWLKQNEEDSNIDRICRKWSKAKGEFSVVREAAINWFHKNWHKEEAIYLMQELLKKNNLSLKTLTCALKWCQKFPANDNSLSRFNLLRERLFKDKLAEDVCLAAEAILTPLISREDLLENIQTQIYRAFGYIVSARSLQTEVFQDRVDKLFTRWLRNPISFPALNTHINNQRPSYFQRVENLIIHNKLDINEDSAALERFLKWINLWDAKKKETIRKSLDKLKNKYPTSDLWEIVRFKSDA